MNLLKYVLSFLKAKLPGQNLGLVQRQIQVHRQWRLLLRSHHSLAGLEHWHLLRELRQSGVDHRRRIRSVVVGGGDIHRRPADHREPFLRRDIARERRRRRKRRPSVLGRGSGDGGGGGGGAAGSEGEERREVGEILRGEEEREVRVRV